MDELLGVSECPSLASLACLEVDDAVRVLYVLTEEESGGGLELTVSDGKKAWSGVLGAAEMRALAAGVKLEEEEFLAETKRALTREDIGTHHFVYSTRSTAGGGMQLAWKKHLISDNIKFQLGSVSLHPVAPEKAHSHLLKQAIATISALQGQVREVQGEANRLDRERQSVLDRQEKFVSLKEDIERDLYGKFKLVLNEKKAKIRRLMDQLSEHNRTLQPQDGSSGHQKTQSSEKDPGNYSSDETVTPSPLPKLAEHERPEPLLGELQETLSPPVKRRRKQEGRRAVGQPEIPRPPSITHRSNSGSKMRVRSGSDEVGGEGKREDSMESDELLNLL